MRKLKSDIHQHCLTVVREKVKTILLAIDAQQEAANNETKSSAGDKYETGRAMAHFEQEKLSFQLKENLKIEKLLVSVNHRSKCVKVEAGSLVETNTGLFYISVAIGQVIVNQKAVYVISPVAPLAQKMLGLKGGGYFEFNGKQIEIIAIG
jgi:hypothetical protein